MGHILTLPALTASHRTLTRRGYNGLRLPDCSVAGAAGSGGGSVPTTNLFLKFMADLGVYSDTGLTTPQTTNGGGVQGWADQSGNANHATKPSGTSPTLTVGTEGGKNGIEFNNQFLTTASITAPTGDFTLCAVWRGIADVGSYDSLLSRGAGANGSVYNRSGTKLTMWNGADVSSEASWWAGTSSLMVTTIGRTGSAVNFWKNGVASTVNPVTSAGAFTSPTQYGICSDTNGSEGGHKVLAALFAYSGYLSSTDRISLHTYLGAYYGITMGGA
jgi:hypothetical protein